jgi:hypothetical protein
VLQATPETTASGNVLFSELRLRKRTSDVRGPGMAEGGAAGGRYSAAVRPDRRPPAIPVWFTQDGDDFVLAT